MNEAEFHEKLDALGRRYSACISNMNAMDHPNLKVGWRQRASDVLDEIQALERERGVRGAMEKAICPPSRDEVESCTIDRDEIYAAHIPGWIATRAQNDKVMHLVSAEVTPTEPASPDPQREMKWWEDLYVSKLLDIIGERDESRAMPTPEELHDIEDKILALGGSVSGARESARIKRLDQIVRATIEEAPPNGYVKERATFPWLALVLTLFALLVATLYLLT